MLRLRGVTERHAICAKSAGWTAKYTKTGVLAAGHVIHSNSDVATSRHWRAACKFTRNNQWHHRLRHQRL